MEENETARNTGAAIAAFIAASVSILTIGVLSFIGEASEPVKDFLNFWKGMGSLSGKIVIAYALGLVVFFALFKLRTLGRQKLVTWTIVLIGSVVVSSLFTFTPFIKLFVKG